MGPGGGGMGVGGRGAGGGFRLSIKGPHRVGNSDSSLRADPADFSVCLNVTNKPSVGKSPVLPASLLQRATYTWESLVLTTPPAASSLPLAATKVATPPSSLGGGPLPPPQQRSKSPSPLLACSLCGNKML